MISEIIIVQLQYRTFVKLQQDTNCSRPLFCSYDV